LKQWAQLDAEGEQVPLLKANTKEIYAQQFSFANIAKNDDVV